MNDTTAPTVTGFTLYGNVLGSSIYVNNTHDLQVVKAAATFGDNISGNTLQIQFSENGALIGAPITVQLILLPAVILGQLIPINNSLSPAQALSGLLLMPGSSQPLMP